MFWVTECVGSYGENCQHPCSHQCLELTCDRVNGRCLSGCKNGTYGEICDIGKHVVISYSCFFLLMQELSVNILSVYCMFYGWLFVPMIHP